MTDFTLFRTNVAQAFWCSLRSGDASFEPAAIVAGGGGERSIAWFDELFKGGLMLPSEGDEPITMLITGPPGSGKTTLAMELCYRLARNEPPLRREGESPLNDASLFSLYISTDQEAGRLLENAESFGYPMARNHIVDYELDPDPPKLHDLNRVVVWGRDEIRRRWEDHQGQYLVDIVSAAIDVVTRVLLRVEATPGVTDTVRTGIDYLLRRGSRKEEVAGRLRPDVLVIDSLNIVPEDSQEDFFQRFLEATSSGSRLVIFVLDSASADHSHEIWEYACDIVLRLDYGSRNDYYLRTMEIVKARYQSHVWGVQQLKIYEKPRVPADDEEAVDGQHTEVRNDRMRRGHPYRTEGGIFIYPSIHYYLSRYKRRGPTSAPAFATTRPELEGVLEQGFPEGRCTAFIGTRGGHKSHFGYLHLLHRLLDHDEGALVVSLRDDEHMTRRTITRILNTEFSGPRRPAETGLEDLRQNDRFEVLYYHPGNITPEEFFHRMFVSIHRMKRTGRKLTVLFNSLDQLRSRFPLCAEQDIFVPGIIEFLSGEGATSIFIAVDEPGQPAEQYGLLPMADLILSFYPRRFRYEDYRGHLLEGGRGKGVSDAGAEARVVEEIVLQVVRFAGGQRAGAQGLLELVDEGALGLYDRPGLHFTQLSPRHHLGFPARYRMGTGPGPGGAE